MSKLEERINTVEHKRNEAIKLVRKSLVDSCNSTINTIDLLIEKVEDKNSKQYKSLVKLKDIINTLISEIVFAQNAESLIKTRKRLNYYITKVRKELELRQIDIVKEDRYKDDLLMLRDDLKEYIKCIKRNDNLIDIKNLSNTTLTREQKKVITRRLSNERKFTKRIVEKYTTPRFVDKINREECINHNVMREISYQEPINIVEPKKESKYPFFKKLNIIKQLEVKKPEEVETEEIVFEELDLKEPIEIDIKESNFQVPVALNVKTTEPKEVEIIDLDSSSVIELFPEEIEDTTYSSKRTLYVNSRMIQESTNYVMKRTKRYDGSFIANISNLISNVPGYLHNKKIIELMKSKYANLYRSSDLRELIKISEETNSFSKAIESIFNRTKIGRKLNKDSASQESRKQELYMILDIMEEYKKEQEGGFTPSDFDYDSLGLSKQKRYQKQNITGEIDFESIK